MWRMLLVWQDICEQELGVIGILFYFPDTTEHCRLGYLQSASVDFPKRTSLLCSNIFCLHSIVEVKVVAQYATGNSVRFSLFTRTRS